MSGERADGWDGRGTPRGLSVGGDPFNEALREFHANKSATAPGEVLDEKFTTISKLAGKQHSPLIIRKFTAWGFPIYIGLIIDKNLDEVDQFVKNFMDDTDNQKRWLSGSIQDKRNLAGDLTDAIIRKWHPVEGVAVVFYVDKMFVSSLYGDPMNHLSCRMELYQLLGTMAHI
jgi:hypothetical protein